MWKDNSEKIWKLKFLFCGKKCPNFSNWMRPRIGFLRKEGMDRFTNTHTQFTCVHRHSHYSLVPLNVTHGEWKRERQRMGKSEWVRERERKSEWEGGECVCKWCRRRRCTTGRRECSFPRFKCSSSRQQSAKSVSKSFSPTTTTTASAANKGDPLPFLASFFLHSHLCSRHTQFFVAINLLHCVY